MFPCGEEHHCSVLQGDEKRVALANATLVRGGVSVAAVRCTSPHLRLAASIQAKEPADPAPYAD